MQETLEQLRTTCQRPDCIQRSVSIYLTKFLLRFTQWSPTHITVIDLIVGVIGSGFFFLGRDSAFIIGGLFLQLFEILDCVDGEMARYLKHTGALKRTRTEESVVEFIQDIVHPILHPLIFFGWSYGLFFQTQSHIILLLGYITALGMSLDTYTNTLREKLLFAPGLQASRVYKEVESSMRQRTHRVPFGSVLLSFIVFAVPIPGVITLLMVAAVIDPIVFHFVKPFVIFGLPVNFKVAVLCAYAVIQPMLWAINVHGSLRNLRREKSETKL